MAQWKRSREKESGVSRLFLLAVACCLLILLVVWILLIRSVGTAAPKYLYWGSRVDCPGKNCLQCGGLGHQESSLRCALEEALVLGRTFVIPSRMCIVGKHNDRALLGRTVGPWDEGSCRVESLYDLALISRTVRVVTDESEEWASVYKEAVRKGSVAHIQGVPRQELVHLSATVINRTASPLAWFVECKDRRNRSGLLLPYTFLPEMAAMPLREAARQIREALGDYDGMHVRRGDALQTRKDRLGVVRTKHPHLDRDTQPEAILRRISAWVPAGRTLYIASNEKRPGYFDLMATRYRLARSSNFSDILEPAIRNNYQLFMVDRLVLAGARRVIQTFKEEPGDLSLTDDEKKVLKWDKLVHTFDDDG